MNDAEKRFFQNMEESISKLPQEEIEKIYRPCAEECVKTYVLEEQRRKFNECHGDLDLWYSMPATEYFFSRVVEKGHIYEMGYPRCLCYMNDSGFTKAPVHCECSRQSIIYVLNELIPNRKFKVEAVQTVLEGSDKCVFRIIIEG